jgi:hypothetical protein
MSTATPIIIFAIASAVTTSTAIRVVIPTDRNLSKTLLMRSPPQPKTCIHPTESSELASAFWALSPSSAGDG